MAAQGIERREVLRILSIAASAATFPGFHRWAFACGQTANLLPEIKPAAYHPLFFSSREYAAIERLTEIIIPADDTPGARDAGVSEFIDLMASRDSELQDQLRGGLKWLESHSKRRYGTSFMALKDEQQAALLEPLAYKAKHRSGEQRGRDFFEVLKEYTVMGFYTSEVGLKQLDFPGFQLYAESPVCPHKDDPEHRHLPPPKW